MIEGCGASFQYVKSHPRLGQAANFALLSPFSLTQPHSHTLPGFPQYFLSHQPSPLRILQDFLSPFVRKQGNIYKPNNKDMENDSLNGKTMEDVHTKEIDLVNRDPKRINDDVVRVSRTFFVTFLSYMWTSREQFT